MSLGLVFDVDTWGWLLSPKGKKYSNLFNIGVAFDHDPSLQNLVSYDSFLDRIITDGREWTDADSVRITMYLQDAYELIGVSPPMVHAYVEKRARDRRRHAVLDWLTPLVWDGTPRIETAFEAYWRAVISEAQPRDYVRAVSRNLFVSLVARVARPGCQSDCMVVFESLEQGVGKTSALRILGGKWYAQSHDSVSKTSFFEALQGAWVVEIGELESLRGAQVERVKTAISTPVDRYRAPYARVPVDRPRQCVFVGTTNSDNWGHDETGLRRFWPMRVVRVDLEALARDRDQLFAEAVIAFNGGATWWQTPDSTTAIQHDRQYEHPWHRTILDYLVGKSECTIDDLLTNAVDMPTSQAKMSHANDVGRILRLAGWTKRALRRDGRLRKVWTAPGDDADRLLV